MPAKRPDKTTREQIEAELKDSELDNALEDVREALLQFEEFEFLPQSSRTKGLATALEP
jgi:hypothetical protein